MLGGWELLLSSAPQKPLLVDDSGFPPVPDPSSPPGLPWHLATCELAGQEEGQRGNFKLSGQNVKFTHEFTQQKEGERPGPAHPMPGSYPLVCTHLPPPPSSSALG